MVEFVESAFKEEKMEILDWIGNTWIWSYPTTLVKLPESKQQSDPSIALLTNSTHSSNPSGLFTPTCFCGGMFFKSYDYFNEFKPSPYVCDGQIHGYDR